MSKYGLAGVAERILAAVRFKAAQHVQPHRVAINAVHGNTGAVIITVSEFHGGVVGACIIKACIGNEIHDFASGACIFKAAVHCDASIGACRIACFVDSRSVNTFTFHAVATEDCADWVINAN